MLLLLLYTVRLASSLVILQYISFSWSLLDFICLFSFPLLLLLPPLLKFIVSSYPCLLFFSPHSSLLHDLFLLLLFTTCVLGFLCLLYLCIFSLITFDLDFFFFFYVSVYQALLSVLTLFTICSIWGYITLPNLKNDCYYSMYICWCSPSVLFYPKK